MKMPQSIKDISSPEDLYFMSYKVANHFGVKPYFLFYDSKKDKSYLVKLGKKYLHKDLIYIGGIPLKFAFRLYKLKVKYIKDGIFWFKDKKEKATYKLSLTQNGDMVKLLGVDGLGYKYIKDVPIEEAKKELFYE